MRGRRLELWEKGDEGERRRESVDEAAIATVQRETRSSGKTKNRMKSDSTNSVKSRKVGGNERRLVEAPFERIAARSTERENTGSRGGREWAADGTKGLVVEWRRVNLETMYRRGGRG